MNSASRSWAERTTPATHGQLSHAWHPDCDMPFTEFTSLKLPAHKSSGYFHISPTSSPPTTQIPQPIEKRQDNHQKQKTQVPIQKPVTPLKPTLKGEGKRDELKQVHWDPEIVDNEHKRQPWSQTGGPRPRLNPSMDTVHPSKTSSSPKKTSSTNTIRRSTGSSSPNSIHRSENSSSLRPASARPHNSANATKIRDHSQHHRSQAANTSVKRKSSFPHVNHEFAHQSPPVRPNHSEHQRARTELRIPPAVPDAPMREIRTSSPSSSRGRLRKPDPRIGESQKPPPTPRPRRLPSPDLPELGCGIFCECCKNEAPYPAPYCPSEGRGYSPQKYEFQQDAMAYMKGVKKR